VILQSLHELAQLEKLIDDPDFEYKPLSWAIRLREDGSLVKIEDLRSDLNAGTNRKPRYAGKKELVPFQAVRTSGDRAYFLVDKAEYIFAVDPATGLPGPRSLQRAKLFRDGVEACCTETHDAAVGAVVKFLRSLVQQPDDGLLAREAKDVAPNDLFAFRVGTDDWVHLRPAVHAYWKRQRSPAPPPPGNEPMFRCLVTGELVAKPGGMPLIKRIPGGTPSGVAIVSHNASAFESYRLDDSENAPVSRAAGEAAARALNRLLDPSPIDGSGQSLPRRYIRLSGDTAVVYWSTDSAAQDLLNQFASLAEAESVEAVPEAYRSIWEGQERVIDNPAAFYAMTITGTQGRAVIRDWFEAHVGEVVHNLSKHFADLKIVRNTPAPKGKRLPPAVPLRLLMDSLAPPGGEVPAALAADFIHAALRGTPYPVGILQRALLRQRAEIGDDDWIASARRDARAALIKAVLNRRRRHLADAAARYPEVEPHMSPNSKSPGYNLGGLLSVIERLQALALGDVNASVIDRYFAAASATPRVVFDRLMKGARHHARKAADEGTGQVFGLERLLDELADRFKPESGGFPSHLDQEQQGLFILGYHQMRKWLWMNKEERAAWEAAHPDAPRAFRRTAKERVTATAANPTP
jgi:CRISPR-associated protein Csd1